jgi:phage terminase large subunit-like protein
VGARNAALVRGPWTPAYVAQHHAFPDGPHDDKVDASADGFSDLASSPIIERRSSRAGHRR